MAAKVNTRFVVILVAVLLALAVGVGGLAAYSLRMSGERNITAGDQLMAEAMQARARGDEAKALELISDAAGQYGRAVSKDTTRRDWLTVWRDTLLQTIPETEVEYDKQLRERYVGALDRLAAIDPTNPEPQLALVSFQDELFRTFGGLQALEVIAVTASRRVLSLPEDSPTAIRIKGLRGLAISDQGNFQTIDHTLRQQAREDMERFYSAFKDDPEAFLAPLGSPDSEAEAEQFAADAREHHSRVALGLIRWHMNERRVAESEGRTSDASNQLRAAVETSRRVMEDGFGYDRDVRFMVLDTEVRALLEGDRVANPAERQRAQVRVLREGAERILPVIRSLDPEAIPLGQIVPILNWDRQWEGREELLAEIERAIGGTPTDAQRLIIAAGALRSLGSNERALELYDQVRSLPRPTLSIEGFILPAQQRAAAYGQVEVNLGEYERARAAGRMDAANAYLEAAKAAREVLAAESGVAERGRVLRADSKIAISQNETRRAIRLLEEFRREFGDTPDVLGELANLLLREGTIGEAKQVLERLVAANTITPQGVILLAEIHRSEGNLDLALRVLETQARRSTTPQEFEDAIAQTRRLIAIEEGQDSDDPIFAAAVRANEAIARRDFAQATSIMDRALRANPEAARDVRFIRLRAQIAALTGDRDGAIEILDRGLALLPGNRNLEQMRNRLAIDNPVESLLTQIEQSDRPAIDKALARYNVLSSVGRQEEARAAIEQAEQIDRNHPAVLDYRFSIALSSADLEAAARVANRASETNADGVDGLLYQGRLQMARGNQAEAVRSLRTASTMIPSSVDIRRYLGLALLESGQIDEGLTTLRRAHEARRDNLQVLSDYVLALRQLGRNQEARELLDPGNDASAVARSNPSVTNLWLTLEAEVGDLARATRERRTYFAADVQTDRFEESAESRENALRLIELLVRQDELSEAEQVLNRVEAHLNSSEALRARTGIALGNAAKLPTPEEVAEAESQAIARFRDQAAAEAQRVGAPGPLLNVARFAFNSGRFDIGLQVLQDAVQYEAAETRQVSREVAQRLTQRAQRLDAEANSLDAQAAQREGIDPRAAEAIRERSAQTRSRATSSREEAAAMYADILSKGGQAIDSDFMITLSLAELRIQLRQFDRASELIQRVRNSQSDNLTALLLAASIAQERGDRTQAGRLYDQAVERHSTNFLPFYQRALFRSSESARMADVLFDLQRVAELRPSFLDSWHLRYRIHMQNGDPNSAFSALRQGIDAAPANVEPLSRTLVQELLRSGRAADAGALASERARQAPTDVYWQYTAGTLARQRGSYREAAEVFGRLMEIPAVRDDETQFAQAASLRLDALLRSEQNTPVPELTRLARLVESMEANDGSTAVSRAMLLARVYANLPAERSRASGFIQEGYTIAARGSDDATPSQLLRLWFGELPGIVGGNQAALDYVARLDEAIRQQIAQAPEQGVEHPVYIRALMLHMGQLRGRSPSELIAQGEALLAEARNDPLARFEILRRLSNLQYATGNVEGAAAQAEAALQINGQDIEMLNNAAFYLAKYLNRVEDAKPYADRVARAAPENPNVLDTVGVVYMLSGDYPRALEMLERALRFARTQEERLAPNVHMADTLIRSGDRQAARSYVETAERLLPVVTDASRQIYQQEVAELRSRLNNP